MPKLTLFSLLLLFIAQHLCAQTTAPTEAWIGTGTVQARIVAGGPLVTNFQIPMGKNDSLVSALRELTIWMGGIDAAGSLRLSIQGATKLKTDFAGGFRDIPQSARVWKVTKEQIRQHQMDFADNGVVDNPIPDIFAWPGYGNPWSVAYNGFAVDTITSLLLAPVAGVTGWWSGHYNPADGDIPFLGSVIYNTHRQPDELLFVPFHVKAVPAYFPNIEPMLLKCSAIFFSYDCDDADFLDHTVFGYVNMQFPQFDGIDSIFFSIRTDGNIGDPQDDYVGFIPGHSLTYFYNADTTFDHNIGAFPPVVGVDVILGIIDTFGNHTGINSVMPLYTLDSGVPIALTQPVLPIEYYRYITGAWRDGTPLSFGGSGYNGDVPAKYIFPGPPFDASGWSEISEGNKPGNRRVLISSGPTHNPYEYSHVNRVMFALNYVSGEQSLSGQWQQMRENSLHQVLFFYGDFFPPATDPYDTLACFKTSSVVSLPGLIPVSIFPNPTRGQLQIDAGTALIQEINVYDLAGRLVLAPALTLPGSSRITLDLKGLPPGLYFIHGMLDNKGQFVQRVVVPGY